MSQPNRSKNNTHQTGAQSLEEKRFPEASAATHHRLPVLRAGICLRAAAAHVEDTSVAAASTVELTRQETPKQRREKERFPLGESPED